MNDPALAPRPEAADPARGAVLAKIALPLAGLGALLSVVAFLLPGGKDRVGAGYLLGFAFCWTVVLGSLFFVALQHVTRSVWSVSLRRVAEMFAAPTGLLALLFVPVVALALFTHTFPWTDPAHGSGDPVLEGKAPYLNLPFWLARAAVFFLLWTVFAAFFVRKSLRQDDGAEGASATLSMRRWSGPFLVVFALTVTFASFDWLMSLDPHWFSTIYGVYVFAGMTLSGLAAITLGVLALRSRRWIAPDLVTSDHLYSLGALLFAFSCFWAYIAFSQFMLIWYANLPEETIWFIHRTEHGWLAVTVLVAVVRFVLPFLLLLARDAKTDARRLALVSVLVLAGQLVDLYWLIMPRAGVGPSLGLAEIGPPLLLVGLLGLALARFLGRHRLVAVGDPALEKARHFHL